jgi:hypothetical protein
MINFKEYINEFHILEKLNLEDIPTDSALEEPEEYDGIPPYRYYPYFGNCVNTVNSDHMWDATQMTQWIATCKVTDINNVLDKIKDGDRKLPKTFLKKIEKLKNTNKLDDLSEIVCGLDDYQKIMFIYISDLDMHFFFDCKK